MEKKIFISHVEEDGGIAKGIADGLEAAGYNTWYYERDGLPALSYLIQTSKAIEESSAVVLIISVHSLSSHQVEKEVVHAHESGKPFAPVLVDISHAEFQTRQPEWRQAIGSATSIRIPAEGVASILPRIVAGLEALSGRTRKGDVRDKMFAASGHESPETDLVALRLQLQHQRDPSPTVISNPAERGVLLIELGYALYALGLGTQVLPERQDLVSTGNADTSDIYKRLGIPSPNTRDGAERFHATRRALASERDRDCLDVGMELAAALGVGLVILFHRATHYEVEGRNRMRGIVGQMRLSLLRLGIVELLEKEQPIEAALLPTAKETRDEYSQRMDSSKAAVVGAFRQHYGPRRDEREPASQQHQQKLARWKALPWWQRLWAKKPEPPQGI